MSKLSVNSDRELIEIAKVLSNKNRLIILKYIISNGPSTLSEIHRNTSEKTGIKHRETTYRYIRKLTQVDLVKKEYKNTQEKFYSTIDSVNLDLSK